jgi:AraC-like DNA-binding protein
MRRPAQQVPAKRHRAFPRPGGSPSTLGGPFTDVKLDLGAKGVRTDVRPLVSCMLGVVRLDLYETTGGMFQGRLRDVVHFGFFFREGRSARRGALADAGYRETLVMRPHEKFRVALPPHAFAQVVDVPWTDFLEAARLYYGKPLKLSDIGQIDLSHPALAALKRNAIAIQREMQVLAPFDQLAQMAAVSYGDVLLNLAVAAMGPRDLEDGAPRTHLPSKLVSRAVDMLRARASDGISIDDVARDLGVSIRTLQLGFRRELGVTPLTYLLDYRLKRAHELLLAADFGTNVQFVAMSCGFASMSKFAKRYLDMFGELPSATLMRARG